MRVLVTGATGFVASHLLPALARDGHRVLALGHDRSRIPEGSGIEPVEVDLASSAQFPDADAVVHLAQANVPFPSGAAQLFAVNTASTAALLEHARRCGAQRFIFASSASVYGFGIRRFVEDDPPRAEDFYSATKLAAERLVRGYGGIFRTTVMRLVTPYGPGQRNRLVPSLVARVREQRPITLANGGRPRMNPIYVDDVVRTVARALMADDDALLNVAGDDVVSIRELGALIGEAAGIDPVFEERAEGASGDLVVDNARLRSFLAEPLVPLREGLHRTVAAMAAV
jgi:UDP-glucose 4-epimerase